MSGSAINNAHISGFFAYPKTDIVKRKNVSTINKNFFNVTPTSAENSIVRNAVAVDLNGTYGHVVYIEAVRNGMVYDGYYNAGDGGVSSLISWYENHYGVTMININ